jgi:hypothetical protein
VWEQECDGYEVDNFDMVYLFEDLAYGIEKGRIGDTKGAENLT